MVVKYNGHHKADSNVDFVLLIIYESIPMKVLHTSFVCGDRRTTQQQVIDTEHTDLTVFVNRYLDVDSSIVADQFTTINEHGVFINDGGECIESFTIIG